MLLSQIRDYLSGYGTVAVSGWGLFISQQPQTAGRDLILYGAAGVTDSALCGIVTLRPRMQVACRAETFEEARAKAEQVFWILADELRGQTMGGTFVHRVNPLDTPSDRRNDPTGKPEVFANYEVVIGRPS